MLAIVDYGVGNLFSLRSSLHYIGQDAEITGDADAILGAERIILPGVGAFEDAARRLRETGLSQSVLSAAKAGRQILGVCLGMQLLFDRGFEFGEHEGLGLIPGRVTAMRPLLPPEYKVPQIGWNGLIGNRGPLFKYVREGEEVYFVHSYFADCDDDYITAYTNYGRRFTAAVSRDNVHGTQFHPEKSGAVGLDILRAFCGL